MYSRYKKIDTAFKDPGLEVAQKLILFLWEDTVWIFSCTAMFNNPVTLSVTLNMSYENKDTVISELGWHVTEKRLLLSYLVGFPLSTVPWLNTMAFSFLVCWLWLIITLCSELNLIEIRCSILNVLCRWLKWKHKTLIEICFHWNHQRNNFCFWLPRSTIYRENSWQKPIIATLRKLSHEDHSSRPAWNT